MSQSCEENAVGTPVFVFGHKNPDNDSVVAATAYAHLKNVIDPDGCYVPVRLGAMPKEAAALFDRYGVTQPELAPEKMERVILVDHNEVAQSAPGIRDMDILEILDHHRIGDIQTAGPILFLNQPVGSTATIVTQRYDHAEVDIPLPIAAILLSAVLTDTVLLRSPTATPIDENIVARLAEQVGVDPMTFGMEVFSSRNAGEPFNPAKVLSTDSKEFHIGEKVALIAQYETVDIETIRPHIAELRGEADRILEAKGYDLVVAMLTDIVREGSDILAVGDISMAERALGIDLSEGSVWMQGVLSRKKQVAAKLVALGG